MIYLDNKHDNVTICMQYMWPITPPQLSFARPRAKHQTNPNQLLDHFRMSLDCTEHVQQAVKPLGYPLEDEFCLETVFSRLHQQNP